MHLEIKQSTSGTETVSALVIDKLYQLAFEDLLLGITSLLDSSSDVQGRIEAPAAYEDAVRYLVGIDPGDTKRFPNLYITVPNQNYYIRFKDSVVSQYCILLYGDGVGVTKSRAEAIDNNLFFGINNSTISKSDVLYLDDFLYFTGVSGEQLVKGFPNASSITFPQKTFSDGGIYARSIVYNCPNLSEINYNGAIFVRTYTGNGHNVNSYQPINTNDIIQDWDSSLLPNQLDFDHICLFNSWKKLKKVIFPEGIAHVYEKFYECHSIEYIEYPSTIIAIGTANGFGLNAQHRPACMVIKATTPPDWWGYDSSATGLSGHGFGWDNFPIAIYVPDSAVSAYTSGVSGSDQAWNSPYILSLIKPLSELPQMYRDMGTVTQADIDRV